MSADHNNTADQQSTFFPMQNPGFDFSAAALKKSYDKVPKSLLQKWEEKQKQEGQQQQQEEEEEKEETQTAGNEGS